MIRKYNYTGRKKILADRIKIYESVQGERKTFNATINLQGMNFPDDAKIYIEPYFGWSFKRFDFGTVARHTPPESTDVSELPTTDKLRYRIKIVDESNKTGLILGAATIDGLNSSDHRGSHKPLLPVDFIELGKRIWTLEFRGSDGPHLALNAAIEGIRDRVKNDNSFFSLVYPEVVKRIAIKLTEASGFFEEDLSGWELDWFHFFQKVLLYTTIPPNDEYDIEEWANDISDAFGAKYKVIKQFTDNNI